jgi:hypothetical protein
MRLGIRLIFLILAARINQFRLCLLGMLPLPLALLFSFEGIEIFERRYVADWLSHGYRFTARGIVALVFSAVAAVVGMIFIAV